MSEKYDIDGVTVTATGGGWYELTHASLPEPLKVQGKEHADTRAQEIAKAASQADDGSMQEQGDLSAALSDATAAADQSKLQTPDAKDDEIDSLKAQLAASEAERERLLKTRTVEVTGGDESSDADVSQSKVPASIPRQYSGVMDDAAKAKLKQLGIETTTIVLEENDNIPPTGLYVGHNGRGYMIMPGEEVTVPNFLLNVLDTAVMSAPLVDSKTQKVLGYRNRTRYPYRKV